MSGHPPDVQQYVGSQLSVITRTKLRYEGTLVDINKDDKTISLSNVVPMGSEGRPTGRFIPKSEQIYRYIIFKAEDVEDLQVLYSGNKLSGASPFNDPAIVSCDVNPTPIHRPGKQYSNGYGNQYRQRGMGGGMMNTGFNRGNDDHRSEILGAVLDDEELKKNCEGQFDFLGHNKKFDKETTKKEFHSEVNLYKKSGMAYASTTGNPFMVRKGYDPTGSFYDDISHGPKFRTKTREMLGAYRPRY